MTLHIHTDNSNSVVANNVSVHVGGYLVKGRDPLLQRVQAVGGGGGRELGRERLQLDHQARVQRLQQGRLGLLLLHLQTLHQLLQLQDNRNHNGFNRSS